MCIDRMVDDLVRIVASEVGPVGLHARIALENAARELFENGRLAEIGWFPDDGQRIVAVPVEREVADAG
jgi:hypothetical protein